MNEDGKQLEMQNAIKLAQERGTQLKLTADGSDESEAIEALINLFADGFGEREP